MTDPMAAFFTLHRDLPREGPGEVADVAWAAALADIAPDARMADLGCGPGADIAALLAAAPRGSVRAVEQVPHFVEAAQARFADDDRVKLTRGDMAKVTGPFDFIWSAGAVYFLGVTEALTQWRDVLAPGGAIAFTEICWWTDTPSARARDLWRGYAPMSNINGVMARIEAAGFDVLGTRRLSDQAWENYYAPLETRLNGLRGDADQELRTVLEAEAEEIACWRAHRAEFGYLLSVVRPR